jgi:hypothetical protein
MTLSTGAKWLGGGSSSRISGGPPEARGASSIPRIWRKWRSTPKCDGFRLFALGPGKSRQSDLQVAFAVFSAAPGDAKCDGMVPFGR